MNTAPSAATLTERCHELRTREAATAANVRCLDYKISKLTTARTERFAALNKIRRDLALLEAERALAPEHHANIH